MDVGYPYQRACEPAGAAYHAYVSLRVLGSAAETVLDVHNDDVDDAKLDAELRARYEAKKKAHKGTLAHDEEDLYELLELGHLRWRATPKQVKDACMYRYLHPFQPTNECRLQRDDGGGDDCVLTNVIVVAW